MPQPTEPPLNSVWIDQFRAAQTAEKLAELFLPNRSLKKAVLEERDRTLRRFLGEACFKRFQERAGQSRTRRSGAKKGNVILLPGVMGSELWIGTEQRRWKVWVDYWYIYQGYMQKLKLDASGTQPAGGDADQPVAATGLLHEYYGEMLFKLDESFNARAFPYDWRHSISNSANVLGAFIQKHFPSQPVTLVAHSMGGLVSRRLMATPQGEDERYTVERLIMLGTPNYGSYEAPMIFAGIQSTVKDLIRLTGGIGGYLSSKKSNEVRKKLLAVLDTFPALYEMLPVEDVPGLGVSASRRSLYDPDAYRAFNKEVLPGRFQNAREFQASIGGLIDPARMAYVAGYNQDTVSGVLDPQRLNAYESYEITRAGDGTVPHALGLLADVPTYFVECTHGDLPRNESVLRNIEKLVLGQPVALPTSMPSRTRSVEEVRKLSQAWAARQIVKDRADDERMRVLIESMAEKSGRAISDDKPLLSDAGAELEKSLVEGVFGASSTENVVPATRVEDQRLVEAPSLNVRLIYGNIATCHKKDEPDPVMTWAPKLAPWKEKPNRPSDLPKDVIALGRYVGVRPFSALSDLDRQISDFLYSPSQDSPPAQNKRSRKKALPAPKPRFYLQDMIDRGLLRGDLATPSVLPDPRNTKDEKRLLVFMGMGTVGQYGESEARRVARELVWLVGQAEKKHLATIVLGAGKGNLNVRDALRGFLDGAAQALRSEPRSRFRIETITFVEYYGFRLPEIDAALQQEQSELASTLRIAYSPYSEAELKAVELRDEVRISEERKAGRKGGAKPPEAPVRIVAELAQDDLWFSAMTNQASVPQRRSELTSGLIANFNDNLVIANSVEDQIDAGTALGKVIPRDLRNVLRSGVPIVMEVDANTARVHWEMAYRQTRDAQDAGEFLGLERGFTRQLRTTFAPPPEPLASHRSVLRALVVADPAPDAPLAAARLEGKEVAELLDSFNGRVPGYSIAVTSLIGPDQAEQSVVMQHLLNGEFDILHFAGHCFFDAKKPSRCGWIFEKGLGAEPKAVLSVRELRALDSIPAFVFSNACESGITPERRNLRSQGLTPAFAEAFFERGVRDFICTAWPVGDAAARVFARTFYARMLGIMLDPAFDTPVCRGIQEPAEIVRAMRDARMETLKCGSGLTTWGAYQHYGNPYTRFFDYDERARAEANKHATASASADPETAVTFDRARAVALKYANRLKGIPGIVDVRPGYRFESGWITSTPAVVVSVLDKRFLPSDDHRLPRSLDGVVVDVMPATPLEQLKALPPEDRDRLGVSPELIAALAPQTESPQTESRKSHGLAHYKKNESVLKAFDEPMEVLCHLSPDDGWHNLKEFLTGPIKQLTVAMYDFTAPHIRDQILDALGDKGKLTLVLCPATGGAKRPQGERGVKDNDFDEDALKKLLGKRLGDRLSFAWAAVPVKGKTTNGYFPRAYHIKVAVKDGKSVWLSSGNWQSSNQPSEDAFPSDESRKTAWRQYNREWNVIIEHPGLATVFDRVISSDYESALKFQVDRRGAGDNASESRLPLLFVPLDIEDLRGPDALPVKKMKAKTFHGKVKVQPILTPDNYVDFVLPLIQNARRKIHFINQSLTVQKLDENDDTSILGKLTKALLEKAQNIDDVKIILRDISGVEESLTALKRLGFPMEKNKSKVRVQPALHTKGIIVDDTSVLVGSQNWTFMGVDTNRDASLLFHDERITKYFEESFMHDWQRLAREKVQSLVNPPRLLLDGATRAGGGGTSGAFFAWDDYFGDS